MREKIYVSFVYGYREKEEKEKREREKEKSEGERESGRPFWEGSGAQLVDLHFCVLNGRFDSKW